MIQYILGTIYSRPFLIGAVIGLVSMRAIAAMRVRFATHSDGKFSFQHVLPPMDKRSVAVVMVMAMVGYCTLQNDRSHHRLTELENRIDKCWTEAYEAVKERAGYQAQDRDLFRQRWDIENQIDNAGEDLVRMMVEAPPGVRADTDRYTAWVNDIAAIYSSRVKELQAQMSDLRKTEEKFAIDRLDHQWRVSCMDLH